MGVAYPAPRNVIFLGSELLTVIVFLYVLNGDSRCLAILPRCQCVNQSLESKVLLYPGELHSSLVLEHRTPLHKRLVRPTGGPFLNRAHSPHHGLRPIPLCGLRVDERCLVCGVANHVVHLDCRFPPSLLVLKSEILQDLVILTHLVQMPCQCSHCFL